MIQGKQTGVTFKDVGGAGEAVTDLKEVTEFLKNPDHFQRLGSKMPKGVLLVGPPGIRKTLLARATAGEAGVQFFNLTIGRENYVCLKSSYKESITWRM